MLYTRETHTPFLVPVFSLSSSISVVPPTPPPLSESQCSGSPARVTRPSVPAGWGRGGMQPDARLRPSLMAERPNLGCGVPRPGGKGAAHRRLEMLGSAWCLGFHHALGGPGAAPTCHTPHCPGTHLLPAAHIRISSLLLFCCSCPPHVPLSVGVWTGCGACQGPLGAGKGNVG